MAFYRDVVGFTHGYSNPDIGWAQFQLGPACLGLECCNPDGPETAELVGRYVGASIEVEDIQAVYQRPRGQGVEFTGPPEKQSWGGTLAHFKDPDGNTLTLLGTDA